MRGTSWVLAAGVVAVLIAFVLWRDASRRVPIGDLEATRAPQHVPLGPVLEAGGKSQGEHARGKGTGSVVGTVRNAGRGVAAGVVAHRIAADPDIGDVYGFPRSATASAAAVREVVSTHSAEDGTFALEGLRRGIWQVRARAADGAFADRVARLEDDASKKRLDFDLSAAVNVLTGTVRTLEGKPWGSSIAALYPATALTGGAALPAAEAAVDGEGRFTLEGLPIGGWFLRIVGSDDIVVLALFAKTPAPGPLDIRVRVPTGRIEVRTVAANGGAPVAGAYVFCAWMSHAVLVAAEGRTDADGRIQLPIAVPADVAVRAEGYRDALATVTEAVQQKVVLLRRESRLKGRVTRVATGEPAPGLTVALAGNRYRATTDADGRYVIDGVSPGTWTVRVQGPGWVSVKLVEAQKEGWNPHEVFVPDGMEVTHDLEVEPAARIEGRVFGPAGELVAGAEVDVFPDRRDGAVYWGADEVLTDAAGRYAIDGLPAGVLVDVRAENAANDAVQVEGLLLTAGPQTVDLRILPGRWIDVRVVAADDGRPVAGAEVEITRNDRTAHQVATDAEGRARAGPMGAGSDLEVSKDGFLPTTVENVAGSEAIVELVRGLPLSGVVLRPDGTPARLADLTARSDDSGWKSETADPAGRFAWEALAPGKWTLTARVAGEPRLTGEVVATAGSTDVVLQLREGPEPPPESKVHVRVLGPAGSVVLAGHVAVLRAGKSAHEATEDGDVSLKLPEAAAEKPFQVVAWGFRDPAGPSLGPAVAGPFRADVGEVTLTVPPELAIVGRVEGLPADLQRGVVVQAYPNAAEDVWQRFLNLPLEDLASLSVPAEGRLQARCAKDGSFRVGGLGPLPFSLVALLPPGWIQERLVIARPDEGLATVRVRRGASATVTVLDEQGQPLDGAKLSLRPDDRGDGPDASVLATAFQSASSLVTDAQGRARLESLRPGMTYDLKVQPKYSREDLLEAEFKDWRPTDLVVRLDASLTVEGVVRDARGRPIAHAAVNLWHKTFGDTEETDAEGRFRFARVRAGTYPIQAAASSHDLAGRDGTDGLQRVAAGTRDLVLVIDPGVPLVLRVPGAKTESRRVVVFERDGEALRQIRYEVPDITEESISLYGLRPGAAYVVWLPPEDEDPRYGFVELADAASGPVTVSLQRGATLRVRLDGTEASLRYLNAQSITGLEIDGEAPYTSLVGCPPGTWRLEAGVREGSRRWHATVTVGTDDMDVVLRPR